jgi:hypothetical protein
VPGRVHKTKAEATKPHKPREGLAAGFVIAGAAGRHEVALALQFYASFGQHADHAGAWQAVLVKKQHRIGTDLEGPPNAKILRSGDTEVYSVAKNFKSSRPFIPALESGGQAPIIDDKQMPAIDSQKFQSLTEPYGIWLINRNHGNQGFEGGDAAGKKGHRDTQSGVF